MRRATFVRISFTSRSQMWRAVTSLPSLPASGPSLTANSIWIVGGSIGMNGSGARSSVSVIVSPMNTSSKPVRPMMSPACASWNLDALHAFEMEDRGDLALAALWPSPWRQMAGSPTLTLPL